MTELHFVTFTYLGFVSEVMEMGSRSVPQWDR